jgi:hypothetical protein
MDLSGQWLSLSRTVKKSTSAFRGKIRVMNLGAQEAPSSALQVYQSANSAFEAAVQCLGEIRVSSIPAGGYVDVSLRLTAPYDGSVVYLMAILDAANALVEMDETNNTAVSGLLQ